MGLWGAAQAIAAGFGGLTGAAAVDILCTTSPGGAAFGAVFTFEAFLFVAAAVMALRILDCTTAPASPALVPGE